MWVGVIDLPPKQRLSNSELIKLTDALYVHVHIYFLMNYKAHKRHQRNKDYEVDVLTTPLTFEGQLVRRWVPIPFSEGPCSR